jgi:hypothetical protein
MVTNEWIFNIFSNPSSARDLVNQPTSHSGGGVGFGGGVGVGGFGGGGFVVGLDRFLSETRTRLRHYLKIMNQSTL